ncbi:rod-binding protein [Thiohalorhabdus sp. Cl-TMA]|uniref:Rod-binding protein n=1 Tax=Thiohalorhabdus methylotrophus TaxID=3242694 RepID=A0ABV4TWX4_9GAMM
MELGFDPQVHAQGQTTRKKLEDLTKKFEAVFLSQAFSTMRETVPKDGLVDTGTAGNLYNSMLDRQVASMGSEKGGLGLSQALYAYLEQGLPEDGAAPAKDAAGKLDTRR